MFENGPADVFERGRQSDRHLLTRGLYLQERRKCRISRKRDYQVAKRVGWVLCMPSFPVASPVQLPGLRPGDCNFPPAELRPTLHSKRGLVPLWRDASLQPSLPQAGKWDLSLGGSG
ncbi:putative Sterile alpha motif domain-containing protein [Naja naja]|nr:putative Sterile alpha motif domain-containing protein [Naja naja]